MERGPQRCKAIGPGLHGRSKVFPCASMWSNRGVCNVCIYIDIDASYRSCSDELRVYVLSAHTYMIMMYT